MNISTKLNASQKGFSLILIILGVVLLLGIAGGASYLWIRINNPVESPNWVNLSRTTPISVSSSKPTTNPAPTVVDETANWKTYTNAKYNFSFKYPTDWDYLTTNDLDYIVFKPERFKVPSQVEIQIPGVALSLMRENYDSAIQRLIEAYGSINKENITSGKLNWVHIWGTITGGQAQGLSGGGYVFNNNGKALELNYEVIKNRSYDQEAKQILSTFKFTN